MVLKQGSCISHCLISLHHLPLFLCCCPFGSLLAGSVRPTSVWEEASSFQLGWHIPVPVRSSSVPAARCCMAGGQLGTASHQRPWSFTLLTEHPFPRDSRSYAALLSTVAKKEKYSTFSPHFTSVIVVPVSIVSPTAHIEPPSSCQLL